MKYFPSMVHSEFCLFTDFGPNHVIGGKVAPLGLRRGDVVLDERTMQTARVLIHQRHDGWVSMESLDPRPRKGMLRYRLGDFLLLVGRVVEEPRGKR